MAKKEEYESRTEALLNPILEQLGFELYDIEFVKEAGDYYLRAYIDKPGGINIDDCVEVSRKLGDRLDAEDFIPEAYILEVSSPGLGRQLKKEKHYIKSLGQEVDIKLFKAENGVKEFTGTLAGYENSCFRIISDGTERLIEESKVARISLHLDF